MPYKFNDEYLSDQANDNIWMMDWVLSSSLSHLEISPLQSCVLHQKNEINVKGNLSMCLRLNITSKTESHEGFLFNKIRDLDTALQGY